MITYLKMVPLFHETLISINSYWWLKRVPLIWSTYPKMPLLGDIGSNNASHASLPPGQECIKYGVSPFSLVASQSLYDGRVGAQRLSSNSTRG